MAQVRIYAQLAGRGQWPSQMARSMKAGRLENEETRRTRWRHMKAPKGVGKQSILAHCKVHQRAPATQKRRQPQSRHNDSSPAAPARPGHRPLHCQHRGHAWSSHEDRHGGYARPSQPGTPSTKAGAATAAWCAACHGQRLLLRFIWHHPLRRNWPSAGKLTTLGHF